MVMQREEKGKKLQQNPTDIFLYSAHMWLWSAGFSGPMEELLDKIWSSGEEVLICDTCHEY